MSSYTAHFNDSTPPKNPMVTDLSSIGQHIYPVIIHAHGLINVFNEL